MKNKKQILKIALWVLFLLIACCAFPIYNFTKSFGIPIMGINLFLNIACYYELGKYEKMTFKDWKAGKITLLNLSIILLGMVLRSFLEFGEVSNTYNFTGPNKYEALKISLAEAGVTVLENQKVQVTRDGESITLMGIHDPSFRTDYLFGDAESVAEQTIKSLQNESDGFTVLLSHRPELFDVYADSDIDLVFSGHAHGGQFRLPFIGGLVAPNQGFFPKYDAGRFDEDNTTMIVSRGVGNSIIPVRFNNRPEIVIAELKSLN